MWGLVPQPNLNISCSGIFFRNSSTGDIYLTTTPQPYLVKKGDRYSKPTKHNHSDNDKILAICGGVLL
jgi:hypothetical protein